MALLELLREELRPHMTKEEQILFPFVAMMEDAVIRGRAMPVPPFDTVEAPIGVMILEHENVAKLLRDIRAITMDFHIPLDGCASYRALMYGLHRFERKLHLHVHLENNILFPRALALESTAGSQIQYELTDTCGEC